MNTKLKSKLELFFMYSIILIMFIVIFYPLLWAFGFSLNPGKSLFSSKMIPETWSLTHYKWLLFSPESNYVTWYKNSLFVSVVNTFFSVIITTLAGYAFSRYKFIGRKNGLYVFLLLQLFPVLMGMVAIYILLSTIGMLDSLWGLSLIYIGSSIPYQLFLVKGYFDTIPRELDEAARIDGGGHLRIFFTIILPLAKPILVVIALLNFMSPFMDFLLPRIVLRNPENYTLALGLYNYVNNEFASNFTRFAAGSILIAVPIATVFLLLQRYLVSGLTSGATKG